MKKVIKKFAGLLIATVMSFVSIMISAEVIPVTLKVGLKNQIGGTLAITETEAGMLGQGELIFKVINQEDTVCLEDVRVETKGGIKGVTSKVSEGDKNEVKVILKRQSKEVATIILSDFNFTVDRMVPEGTYDLEISGSAICADEMDKLVVEDFIKITTPSTCSLPASALPTSETSFTINNSTYKVNNKPYEMEAAPYLQGEGYTMVPVRYVAKAFGVEEKNIVLSGDNVILFAGSRMIILGYNTNKIQINGVEMEIEAPTEMKAGRLYLPAGALARILGVSCKWDDATKTATFTS